MYSTVYGVVYTKSSNSCFLSGSSGTCCCLREYLHYMLLFQGIDTNKCYVCRKFSLQNNVVFGKFLLSMSLFPIYSLDTSCYFYEMLLVTPSIHPICCCFQEISDASLYFQELLQVCAATFKIFFRCGLFICGNILPSCAVVSTDQCVVVSRKFSSLCCFSQHINKYCCFQEALRVVVSRKDIGVLLFPTYNLCSCSGSSNSYHGWFQNRARIFKLLRSPGTDSKEPIPPGCVAWQTGAGICRPLMETRNRFPAWRADMTTLFFVPARQATQSCEIDSSESIPGLHKCSQIRALYDNPFLLGFQPHRLFKNSSTCVCDQFLVISFQQIFVLLCIGIVKHSLYYSQHRNKIKTTLTSGRGR